MFKAVISQSNLKDIIDAVSHIDNEVKIQLLEDGLKIEAVDPANVAMVFLHATSGSFEYFKSDKMEIAMDIMKLASLAAGKESVTMELDEEAHKLRINVGRSKFKMSLLDPASLHAAPRIPSLDLPCAIVMNGGELRAAVQSAAKVSDHIIIEQHEAEFKISGKGDIDSFEAVFPLAELTGIRQGESRAMFSLDYVDDISKVAAKADQVLIETGIDYPAKITFNPRDTTTIQYLLAPRIEQE
jgi:proliferating cell nuclear antigen